MAGICTQSVAVFLLTPHRAGGAGGDGEYWSVRVNARVVNRKQVDVAALRSDRSGCPGMR